MILTFIDTVCHFKLKAGSAWIVSWEGGGGDKWGREGEGDRKSRQRGGGRDYRRRYGEERFGGI